MNRSGPTASFLDHAPVSLAFGTSGLRGLVKDITDLEAYINVKGALLYLLGCGDIRAGDGVVLAGDLRPSTDRIMRACARAIVDSGCAVENAGKIPTPALILHAVSTGRAGVMVSGSHIPFDRNGIKINKSVGEVLKSDESGITREVERIRIEEYGRTATGSAFAPSGMFKTSPDLPSVHPAAEERYVRRYLTSFTPGGLEGLRVLVYEHSAVGRDTLGRILRELGAEVVTAGRAETFIPIDTENVTDELLDRLQGLVAEGASGRPLDAVVSTDGDSDRPLVAAVLRPGESDSRGRHVRFLPGDLLGIVVAEYLRADAVAVPISANDAVERRMSERGILLRKTKIGSPYVVSGIDELHQAGTHARIVGWEANGGFLVGSAITLMHGVIDALPTRDSTLPILANLFAAKEQRVGLAALWDRLPARFGRAGLIDGVPVAVSKAILAHLVPPGDTIEVEIDRAGRVAGNGPDGGTPALLEEAAAGVWRERKATLARFFTTAGGFDDIVRINVLDGVRVHFRNGDVAHVRPSGNAPQLRMYANSDSQTRADQIVELGLREPDGILRLLERAFV
jgi:phosphomannomutase